MHSEYRFLFKSKIIISSSDETLRSAIGYVIDLNNEIISLIGVCILSIRNSATWYSGKDARDLSNMDQLDDP